MAGDLLGVRSPPARVNYEFIKQYRRRKDQKRFIFTTEERGQDTGADLSLALRSVPVFPLQVREMEGQDGVRRQFCVRGPEPREPCALFSCSPCHYYFLTNSGCAWGSKRLLPSLANNHGLPTSRLWRSRGSSTVVWRICRLRWRSLRLANLLSSFSDTAVVMPMNGSFRRDRLMALFSQESEGKKIGVISPGMRKYRLRQPPPSPSFARGLTTSGTVLGAASPPVPIC